MLEKSLQVIGIVKIQSDTRQLQNDARFAGRLGCSQMRFEAVVAEAKREEVCGPAEGSVGSTSIGGRSQHRAFGGSMRKNLLDLAGLNQRNVRGNDERAVDAARYADLRGHFDGAGFPWVREIRNDFEIVFPRQFESEWVTCNQRAGRPSRPGSDRSYNVMQHELRQFGACRLIHRSSKPLLGRREILYRDQDHGWSEPARAGDSPETGLSATSPLVV